MSIEGEAEVSLVFEFIEAAGLSGSSVRSASLSLLQTKLDFAGSLSRMKVNTAEAVPVSHRQRELLKEAQSLMEARNTLQSRLEGTMRLFLEECEKEPLRKRKNK